MSNVRPVIHLVNPMFSASGGSEQRTLGLYRELSPFADVTIWATDTPDPRLGSDPPIRIIGNEHRPSGGVVVIVGVWYGVGEWIRHANPSRIVLLYNTDQPYDFAVTYRRLNQYGFYNVEVVAASRMLLDGIDGIEGVVQPSPIDIERFAPGERPNERFNVGRLSRDVPEKHHAGDPGLYARLAEQGCRVRVMGGTCLANAIGGRPGIELLPALSEPAEQFLRSLDCFYYRTHDVWAEAFGRVIAEAMATGLPVVAHRSGGYREFVQDGVDGFLFETEREAEAIILELKRDPARRRAIGQAARRSMERMFGEEARRELVEFYIRSR